MATRIGGVQTTCYHAKPMWDWQAKGCMPHILVKRTLENIYTNGKNSSLAFVFASFYPVFLANSSFRQGLFAQVLKFTEIGQNFMMWVV